jgi:transcription antitermination protein NusB
VSEYSANTRRIERERVLSLLYEAEMKDQPIAEVLASLPVGPDAFVAETIVGVSADLPAWDALIDKYAHAWKSDRMPSIDRTVLRIGAYELRDQPDLPVAVIISEAVELAKKFSTEESGKFVNGLLSSIASELRAEQ